MNSCRRDLSKLVPGFHLILIYFVENCSFSEYMMLDRTMFGYPHRCRTRMCLVLSTVDFIDDATVLEKMAVYFKEVYHQFMLYALPQVEKFCNKCFESAILLPSGSSTSTKTSVKAADHSFEKCICLSTKIKHNIQWTFEKQWCFHITTQCCTAISFRINLYQSQTKKYENKDLATSPDQSSWENMFFVFCFLFCSHRSRQTTPQRVGKSWDNRRRQWPKL